MKTLLALACIGACAWSQTGTTKIVDNGDPANRVDIVVVGDGYTAAEMPKFMTDTRNFVDLVFLQEPYREYAKYFNVTTVEVPSVDSGADHPELPTPVYRNTAFDATYDCAGIDRLICVSTSKVNTAIAVLPPNRRDMVIVLVNDTTYGGSGGAVAVASLHPQVAELVLHETGHSFGFLADEYGGPPPPACITSSEPSEVNVTLVTTRAQIKWNAWIETSTPIPTPGTTAGLVGLYQGGRYCDTGMYRPTYNSKMRSLGQPFEPVNSEQLIRRYYNYVDPIDGSSPAGTTVNVAGGATASFSVTPLQPRTHELVVTWSIDGTAAGMGPNFTLPANLAAGNHTVAAAIVDPTTMVRIDTADVLKQTRTWTVVKAQTCTFTITPAGVSRPSTAGSGTFALGVQAGCSWTAASDAAWLAVTPASGTGPSNIQYSVSANTGSTARTGHITAGGQTFTVLQNPSAVPVCTFALGRATDTPPATGQESSTSIVASDGNCTWTAASDARWLQVYPLSGTGSGILSYSVYPSFSTLARTGRITAGAQTLTVNQAAAGGTSNERFVRLLYFSFLGRAATDAEIAFHAGSLSSGVSRLDLAMNFFGSTEFNLGGRFVAGLYLGLLARDAEYAGWLFQRNALVRAVVTQDSLVQNFLNSTEYALKFGSPDNPGYVRLLYRHVLLREATQAEVDFQAAQLNSGGMTRVALARAFLNSPEFRNGTGPRLTAFLLYATLLMRDTSDAERTMRANQIASGTPVRNLVSDFIGSAEFQLLIQ